MPETSLRQLLEQAVRFHQSGQLREAEALYRQVLSSQPDNPDALHYLGVLAGQGGRHDVAIDLIRRSLALRPDEEARFNLASSLAFHALALCDAGQSPQAITLLRESLTIQPDNADTYVNLALALRQSGNLDEAIDAVGRAVKLNPNSAEAHNNLGNLLQEKGEPSQAIAAFNRAVSLRPDWAEAHNNLGNALRDQGRLDESQASLRQALRLRPDTPQIHNNLANALRTAGNLAEAIDEYRRAVTLAPNYAQGWNNLGVALRETGRIDGAIGAHRRAIAIEPNLADAHFALAFALLLSGNFSEGWSEYEWRLKRKSIVPVLERNWDGADLDGRTILLHAEQGFGDTIHFARYIPLVVHRGGRVVVACQRELVRLLQQIPAIERVLAIDDPVPGFHVHCPLMSLPLIFGTDRSSIPGHVPYIAADSSLATDWVRRIGNGTTLKVGLAWSGRPTHPDDRNRSMPLAALAPLGAIPNVSFHSLQPGALASGNPSGLDIIDHTTALSDFSQTAALIDNLDLIISADTAVVHLAGAMAKPVWLMLPFSPDWRWMLGRDDSPWYPTMRLFRQPAPRDWACVVARIVQALGELPRGL